MIELLEKAKNNDREAIEKLLDEHKNIIDAKVSKYYVQGMEKDDLYQEASIAFLDCIKNFDIEKNDNFPAFASICIERRLITLLSSSQRQKYMALNTSLSLDNFMFVSDEDKVLFLDILECETDSTEEKILKAERMKEFKTAAENILSDFEFKILNEYLKGFTYKEMAEAFDTNEKAIDNAIQRIRNKLKQKKLL